MQKFSFPESTEARDLPFGEFNNASYSIYVIDLNWNYIFVNDIVYKNLDLEKGTLIGKNMWVCFPLLKNHPSFKTLKEDIEKGREISIMTVSPLTSRRIYVSGKRLKDCYFFTSSHVPNKEDVISDLKSTLRSKKVRA